MSVTSFYQFEGCFTFLLQEVSLFPETFYISHWHQLLIHTLLLIGSISKYIFIWLGISVFTTLMNGFSLYIPFCYQVLSVYLQNWSGFRIHSGLKRDSSIKFDLRTSLLVFGSDSSVPQNLQFGLSILAVLGLW